MKKIVSVLILSIFFVGTIWCNQGLSHKINSQLLVLDSNKAGDLIVDWCENIGGYYIQRTPDVISLRIPNKSLPDLKPFLESISEDIVSYTQNSNSLTSYIAELKSGIKAREDILVQNLFYLDTSDVEGTLTLEREIRRLRSEVDSYKGSLRKHLNDIEMATVVISITFRSRTLNNQEYSSFDWVNEIDFYSVMNSDMKNNNRGSGGAHTTLPTGFALVDTSPRLKAISSEGGRLILDSFKNYPKQELKFWEETLFNHLEKKGYLRIGVVGTYEPEGEIAFTAVKWGVPYGNVDYIFMTGIRLNKNRIEVLQVATETNFFESYISFN
ncbi:MAG: DUF4349 domain-containing protein [Spirochaetaceae bacterium]